MKEKMNKLVQSTKSAFTKVKSKEISITRVNVPAYVLVTAIVLVLVLFFTVLCSAKTKSDNEFFTGTVVSEEEYDYIAVLLDNPSEVHLIKVEDFPFEVEVGDRIKIEKFTHFVFGKDKGNIYKCVELVEKTKLATETE